MASITHDAATGHRLIQFYAADGKRRTVRLGKVSQRQAEAVALKVDDLLAATITNQSPRRETLQWVADLGPKLHNKLAKAGLVEKRASATLAAFIDEYTHGRSDVKPSTATVYKRVRRYLVDYFGSGKQLREITPGDADAWRLDLLAKGRAENTVRRSCGIAKQFFTAAVRRRLLDENPFAGLTAAVKANPERFHFVTREAAGRVLDACPDAEWRLLFVLARYGGLRVPSEVLRLRWQDIDWQRERFTVTSPKTEHHAGGGSRQVPIFPELMPYLREAFELAPEGAVFCVSRYRDPAANLRTQLQRIIKRAGLEPWPKLWQNLRSTRETELADEFPAHVASAWIGNSVAVAVKHYLQTTDEHFEKALRNPVLPVHADKRSEAQEPQDGSPQVEGESEDSGSVQPDAVACVSGGGGEKWAILDSNQ